MEKARRVLKLATVCDMLDASKSSIWRWLREDPSFPRPFKLGPQLTVWDAVEIEAWIAVKSSARKINVLRTEKKLNT